MSLPRFHRLAQCFDYPRRTALYLAVVALCGSTVLTTPGGAASAAGLAPRASSTKVPAPAPRAAIRVDQLGWTPAEHKTAYLMVSKRAPHARFTVVGVTGRVVLRGHVRRSRGGWNKRYVAVYPIPLTSLRRTGQYRIRALGVSSPPFRIGTRSALFLPRVSDAAAFFRAQRDGAHVIPGPLHRKPSHLNDAQTWVYRWPTFASHGSDVIAGRTLHRVRGPVDVAGGWFDAGDFIKFAHTTAYTDTMMFAAERALGRRTPPGFDREARFGLRWLRKAWEPRHHALVIQVGIGSGNRSGTFLGDHDRWRLPQVDDHLTGPQNRYLRHRPVFVTDARRGHLAPNLAGRMSASFALAAQLDARRDPARARRELVMAAHVYRSAKTSGVRPRDVVTALPHAFYPESSWRDDLELGGAELARAAYALHDPRAHRWLRQATHWAAGYLTHGAGGDTLNLYDDSALAHVDLVRLLRAHPLARRGSLVARLLRDLRGQLHRGMAHAASDPFAAGGHGAEFDVASHTFGLVATAEMYAQLTGSHRYNAFGTSQRAWVFGANPFGSTMMIGVGTKFPRCPQHVVANLSGSLDGTPPVLRGAVVNGPNDAGLFQGGLGGFFSEARRCPPNRVDRSAAFTGHGSRFVDDVRSWQTVEPALDFTASATLAMALEARKLGSPLPR